MLVVLVGDHTLEDCGCRRVQGRQSRKDRGTVRYRRIPLADADAVFKVLMEILNQRRT